MKLKSNFGKFVKLKDKENQVKLIYYNSKEQI